MAKRRALEVVMLLDSKGFSAGVSKVNRETGRLGSKAGQSSRGMGALGSTMKRAAVAAAGLAAGYVSVAQAREAVNVTQELGLATMGLRRNLGMATGEASRWAAVTRARGIDSKALTMAFTTLARRIDDARDGSESAIAPFRKMGVSQKELASASGNYSKQVDLVAEALGRAKGGAERQAVAQRLLGRGYQSILPMFTKGAKGLKDQLRWADEFGATLDGKTVDAIDKFTTAQRRSKVATMGLQIAFARHAIPALTKGHEAYQKFVRLINDDSLTREQKIDRLRQYWARISGVVMDTLERLAPQIAQQAGELGVRVAKGIAAGFVNTGFLGKAAISAWLLRSFSRFGGFGLLQTFGATAGTTIATSTAGEMASGGGAISRAAGGWKAAILGGVRSAGIGMAVAGTIWAGMDAYKALKPVSGSMMEQLDQISGKADTVQSKIGGLFRGLPKVGITGIPAGIVGGFGFDKLGEAGANANRLKVILAQINTVGAARYGQLVAEGRQIAANLGLTRQAKREVDAQLMSRSQAMSGSLSGIDRLASGMITRFQDIRRITAENAALIARAWGKNTPEWRSATARNMDASIQAIKAGMEQGAISTRRGWARIRAIIHQRQLVTGSNVGGVVKGFRATWLKAGNITNRGIKGMIGDLKKMPPAAREQAQRMMLRMARQLVLSDRLPKGAMSRLRSALVTEFGVATRRVEGRAKNLGVVVGKHFRTAGSGVDPFAAKVKSGSRRAESSMSRLATSATRSMRKVKRAISSTPGVASSGYGRLASATNSALSAFGSDSRVSLRYRGGGEVPFSGQGRQVPAMVSPGERVDYKGRSWIVPGRPVARDSVAAMLPAGAHVMTSDGQMRMAMGESQSSALRTQAPHFRSGGTVESFSSGGTAGSYIPKVRMGGGSPPATRTGNRGLAMVRQAAVEYLRKHMSPPEIRRMLETAVREGSKGYEYSWGGGHATLGKGPYDCSGYVSAILGAGGFINSPMTVAQGTGLYTLGAGGDGNWATWGVRGSSGRSAHTMISIKDANRNGDWRYFESGSGHGAQEVGGWAGSFSHRHMPRFGRGGKVTPRSMRRKAGRRKRAPWIRKKYRHINANQAYTLAVYGGIPNPRWASQVMWGESSGNPRTVGHDEGGTLGLGLWQITTGFNDHIIRRYGGRNAMFDPVTNARAARDVYRERQQMGVSGESGWYGRLGPAGHFLPGFYNEIMWSPQQRKFAARQSRRRRRSVSGLWKRIRKANRRGYRAGGKVRAFRGGGSVPRRVPRWVKRQAGLSRGFADKAMFWAKRDPSKSLFWRRKSLRAQRRAGRLLRRWSKNRRKVIRYQERQKNNRPGGGNGGGGNGGGGNFQVPVPMAGSAGQLPPDIQRMLKAKYLTGDQKRSILDMAVGRAEDTDTIEDDRTALGAVMRFEGGRLRTATGRFKWSSKRIRGMRFGKGLGGVSGKRVTAGTIKVARKQVGRINKTLGRMKPKGKKGKWTRSQLRRRNRSKRQKKRIAARIGEFGRLTEKQENALSQITDSESSIREADRAIKDLSEKEKETGSSDLAEEIKALREEIAKQNAMQARAEGIDYTTLRRAMTDMLSGDLAGRADPPRRLGFSPAVNF